MLTGFGPSLYMADRPTVPFFGFPYSTGVAVARLSDGDVWVWPTRQHVFDYSGLGEMGSGLFGERAGRKSGLTGVNRWRWRE